MANVPLEVIPFPPVLPKLVEQVMQVSDKEGGGKRFRVILEVETLSDGFEAAVCVRSATPGGLAKAAHMSVEFLTGGRAL